MIAIYVISLYKCILIGSIFNTCEMYLMCIQTCEIKLKVTSAYLKIANCILEMGQSIGIGKYRLKLLVSVSIGIVSNQFSGIGIGIIYLKTIL